MRESITWRSPMHDTTQPNPTLHTLFTSIPFILSIYTRSTPLWFTSFLASIHQPSYSLTITSFPNYPPQNLPRLRNMERGNRKRGREEDVEYMSLSDQNTGKKDVYDQDFVKHGNFIEEDNKVEGNENGAENYTGVFDFPWLKEGVISKSEEWRFEEDVFADTYTAALMSGFELSGQCLCESAATCMSSISFPVEKFEENVWSLKAVDDCSSWPPFSPNPFNILFPISNPTITISAFCIAELYTNLDGKF